MTQRSYDFGFSLNDEKQKNSWLKLIQLISDTTRDYQDKFLFHGTSSNIAKDILNQGMKPTDVGEIYLFEDHTSIKCGSFFGDIATAAWHAEDTVKHRHPNCKPVLLCVRIDNLQKHGKLLPDLCMLEMPLPFSYSENSIYEKWQRSNCNLSWKDAILDFGSAFLPHQSYLDKSLFTLFEPTDGFDHMCNLNRKEAFTV